MLGLPWIRRDYLGRMDLLCITFGYSLRLEVHHMSSLKRLDIDVWLILLATCTESEQKGGQCGNVPCEAVIER